MKGFGRGVVAASFVLMLGACDTVTDAPLETSGPSLITFGQPDAGAHPHVGTMLFVQNGVGFFSCSGTLLSSTVMLTTGHCVKGGGQLNSVTYVRFTEDALAGINDYPSLQAWLNAEWILASAVIAHPQFDDFAEFPNIFDVGLVVLPQPVNLGTYGALPELGLLERLTRERSQKNNLFTAVGYGVQGVINPFNQDDFSRRKGTVRLVEIKSTFTGPGQSAKFSNNPGQGNGAGGTCFGDSGGPIFHGTSNVIGAITSFGITPCIGVEYHFRIDTEIAQDFITAHLD